MAEQKNHPLLFEMLRSFTTLAETLNMSVAVKEMGITRQTMRRHIDTLEDIKGAKLFVMVDRQFELTETGRKYLPEAEDILARGLAWLNNETRHVGGLPHISQKNQDGWFYHLQQQPIGSIWSSGDKLLTKAIECWAQAGGVITDEAFAPIRDYLMVFRKNDASWICTAVGNKSSYATWYGWRWESSSVGRQVSSLPGGSGHAALLSQPFEEVRTGEGLRYDHVHTIMNRGEEGVPEPISFKRLLLGCRYPDESFAMASMVVRSYALNIEGLSQEKIESMPSSEVMDGSHLVSREPLASAS